MMKKVDKAYVSDIDKFLTDLKKRYPKLSESQKREQAKMELWKKSKK